MDEPVIWDRYNTYIRGKPILHTTVERDYVCGICEHPIITVWRKEEPHTRTICSHDESHEPGDFITKRTLEIRRHRMWVYQQTDNRRIQMGFVKDRHDEDGRIIGRPSIRRSGRISLGRQLEGGGAEALPYFTFKMYESEALVAEALQAQVFDCLERLAPGQDYNQPTVLPVLLPADTLSLIASSVYKLAGQGGLPRCVGDGQYIQFKTGARNRVEVYNGEVAARALTIDKTPYAKGDVVRCPGRDQNERWAHCEKCRLTFTVDLMLGDLPYIFSLSTGDQLFYNQFFSTFEQMVSLVRSDENVLSIVDIPLLLRREPHRRPRPETTAEGVELRYQEMEGLSIQIHPVWLAQVTRARVKALGPSKEIKALYDEGENDELFQTPPAAEGVPLPPDALLVEIPAGPHANKTLKEMWATNPEYVIRIASEAYDEELRRAAQIVMKWYGG